MDNTEYFVKVKSFSHIPDEDLEAFSDHVTGVALNPSKGLMD